MPANQIRRIDIIHHLTLFNWIKITTIRMSIELVNDVIGAVLMHKSPFLVEEGCVATKHTHPVIVLVSECGGFIFEALDRRIRVLLPDK